MLRLRSARTDRGRVPHPPLTPRLKHEPAEIRIPRNLLQLAVDIRPVDHHARPAAILGIVADVLEQLLHHRLKAARADILDLAIHFRGDAGDGGDAVLGELDRDLLGGEQRLVLERQRRLRVGQDRDEIGLGQALELDADRQATLKLGQQVAAWRRGMRPTR